MSKYVKNNSGSDSTYSGQVIANGVYYLIQSHEEPLFANDSLLLTDIGSGDAIIAKDDSGNNNIIIVSDAINYLKDNVTKQVEIAAIQAPNGKRARLIGTHSSTAAANTTTACDWVIPQMQYPSGTDVSSIFNGIQYYAENSNMGDSLCFSVVDIDGSGVTAGLYPQAYYDTYKDGNSEIEIEKFGLTWYLAPNSMQDIILYKARLYPGLVLRVKYNNSHATNTVKFICNIFRHLDI